MNNETKINPCRKCGLAYIMLRLPSYGSQDINCDNCKSVSYGKNFTEAVIAWNAANPVEEQKAVKHKDGCLCWNCEQVLINSINKQSTEKCTVRHTAPTRGINQFKCKYCGEPYPHKNKEEKLYNKAEQVVWPAVAKPLIKYDDYILAVERCNLATRENSTLISENDNLREENEKLKEKNYFLNCIVNEPKNTVIYWMTQSLNFEEENKKLKSQIDKSKPADSQVVLTKEQWERIRDHLIALKQVDELKSAWCLSNPNTDEIRSAAKQSVILWLESIGVKA